MHCAAGGQLHIPLRGGKPRAAHRRQPAQGVSQHEEGGEVVRHQGEYYDDATLLYCDLVTLIMLPCQVTQDNRVAGTSQQNRQITCDQARNADKALYCGSGGELSISLER